MEMVRFAVTYKLAEEIHAESALPAAIAAGAIDSPLGVFAGIKLAEAAAEAERPRDVIGTGSGINTGTSIGSGPPSSTIIEVAGLGSNEIGQFTAAASTVSTASRHLAASVEKIAQILAQAPPSGPAPPVGPGQQATGAAAPPPPPPRSQATFTATPPATDSKRPAPGAKTR